MEILVIYDDQIQAWLVNEPIDDAEQFIANGYPHLLDEWTNNMLTAAVIDVPEADTFRADLYEIVNNQCVRKE